MHGKTISATEARIRFGEVLRSAQEGPVVVERQGKALVVVLSKEHYDELVIGERASWRDLAARAREMVVRDRAGDPLPDPAWILRYEREAQDERHGLR